MFSKKKAAATVTPIVIAETKQENGSHAVSAHRKISHHTVDMPISVDMVHTPKTNFCQQCCTKENLKEQALLLATITAVIVGIAVGIGLRDLKCTTGKQRRNFFIYSPSIDLL
jgi:hypothetical protein